MNETPRGERLHIGIFGRRNAGKSSLINAIAGQDVAVVSSIKGTTTDPVYKSMELLPIGPVVLIDTPGTDDEGELGNLRVEKTRNILRKTDIALVVVDSTQGLMGEDRELIEIFRQTGVKYLVVYSKSDLSECDNSHEICVSVNSQQSIENLKEAIAKLGVNEYDGRLAADLLEPNDVVVLVVPLDKAAPKGRLILPQQQVIRDVLEAGAVSIVTRETELTETLSALKNPPKLVITDSQVFEKVAKTVPAGIALTSFSILMARYKGVLEQAVAGARAIDEIKDGDKILIAEACTHHRQCDDIGTVKIPKWIEKYTKASPEYEFSTGGDFPQDLSGFKLIIHCGGCMINAREMKHRHHLAGRMNIPITNFGVAISHMKGILQRCIAPFDM